MADVSVPFVAIPLTQGKHFLIDRADEAFVRLFKWTLKSGPGHPDYVIRAVRAFRISDRTLHQINLRLHRELLRAPAGIEVDHINGDGLDNRRHNIRLATRAQNVWNNGIRSDNSSGFRGVFYQADRRRFVASLWFGGRYHFLGRHRTAVEAAEAYNRKARECFGEYARLNVIGVTRPIPPPTPAP